MPFSILKKCKAGGISLGAFDFRLIACRHCVTHEYIYLEMTPPMSRATKNVYFQVLCMVFAIQAGDERVLLSRENGLLKMQNSLNEKRVAVVDYNPETALQLQSLQQSAVVRVSVFSLGSDLLASHGLQQFSCIVLELSMPDIDGFPMMARLASLVPSIPIVLTTGHSHAVARAAELYADSMGLNIEAVLCRLFTGQELRRSLARYL